MNKILFLCLFVLFAQNSVKGQGVWENIKTSVIGTGCLVTITPKLTDNCLDAFNKEFDSRPKDEKDNKAVCCAYLSLQSCVMKISSEECGKEGETVSKSFLKTINRGITSDDCIDYGFITCITFTQIAIAVIISLAIMSLLSCICCCCCRLCRK